MATSSWSGSSSMAGAELDKQGESGAALHRALARRHVDVVALLVARGADVNVDNQLLGTPLHVAAGTGKEALVLLLLDNGADLAVARGSDGLRRCTSPPKRGAPRSSASCSTVAPTSTC